MKITLVAHWRLWWRRWSSWLAVLAGTSLPLLLADRNATEAVRAVLTGDWAALRMALAGLLIAAVPIVLTHVSQSKLKEKRDGLS